MARKANTTATKVPMWTDISGAMRLFCRERKNGKTSFLTFSTSVARKNEDGEYFNTYYDVMFKKNEAPTANDGEAFYINVTKGFVTTRTDKNGANHHAIMVLEWEDADEVNLPF